MQWYNATDNDAQAIAGLNEERARIALKLKSFEDAKARLGLTSQQYEKLASAPKRKKAKVAQEVSAISAMAFRAWRLANRLDLKVSGRELTDEEIQDRLRVIKDAPSLAAAAREIGVTPGAIRAFQQRHDKAYDGTIDSDRDVLMRKLYLERHMDDKQVAKHVGIARATAIKWRHNNLPELNFKKLSAKEERKRLHAYNLTANDQEAAALLEMESGRFAHWRMSRGLPGKGSHQWNSETLRRMAAYRQSSNDSDAAKRLGMHVAGYTAWRLKHGLPAKTTDDENFQIYVDAYLDTATDAEAADQLLIPEDTFTEWRKEHNLPRNHDDLRSLIAA